MYEMMIKSVGNYFAEGKDITKLLTKELESMNITRIQKNLSMIK